MCHFMDDQIKAGGIKRILNVEPVEDYRTLLPALPGLYNTLIMYQPNIVFPFIVHDKRGGVDENFMKPVEPLNPQFQNRQTEKQSNARTF